MYQTECGDKESHRGEGARMQWLYAKWKPLWATEEIIEGSGERGVKQGDKERTVKRGIKTRGKGEINSL